MFNSEESQTSGFDQLLWNASHFLLHMYEGSHPQHILLCKQRVTRSITTIYTKIICTYTPVHIHFCSTLQIPVVEGELQSGNSEKITNKINPDPHC